MKNKRTQIILIIVAAVLLLSVAAGMIGLYKLNQEGVQIGEKNVTVTDDLAVDNSTVLGQIKVFEYVLHLHLHRSLL